MKRKTTNEFIEQAKKVHGNKYDYSKVVYGKNNKEKVRIICPTHGEFWQAPVNHIYLKQGCPFCGRISTENSNTKTTDDFIKEAKKIHGSKYDYSKVIYKNWETKVCIVCPIHGEFWVTPSSHLQGVECKKCASSKKNLTTDEFIEKAKKIHGDYYDYSKVCYTETYSDVEIICPKHGSFYQKPINHLQGCGCRKCGSKNSSFENEICDYITNKLKIDFVRNERVILQGKEIDIFIPKYNIGIELNGIRWHSEGFGKKKYYHLEKLEKCSKIGVKLIEIFEDEYIFHKNIVLNKLSHLLNNTSAINKISGRDVVIKPINKKDSDEFLEKYHLQGKTNSSINLGAFFGDILVSVMTFIECKNSTFELSRFATNDKYLCRGIGGKLLSFFKKKYKWTKIKSFADRRWILNKENNLYIKLGFKLTKVLPPDYKYVVGNRRIDKFDFEKQTNENAKRIWDCGLLKYELDNS